MGRLRLTGANDASVFRRSVNGAENQSSGLVRPVGTKVTCAFSNGEAGRYAVAVWHDPDSDGKLDTNFLGIPSDAVGSSNNAKGGLGPRKFKDAAVNYRPPSRRQNNRVE